MNEAIDAAMGQILEVGGERPPPLPEGGDGDAFARALEASLLAEGERARARDEERASEEDLVLTGAALVPEPAPPATALAEAVWLEAGAQEPARALPSQGQGTGAEGPASTPAAGAEPSGGVAVGAPALVAPRPGGPVEVAGAAPGRGGRAQTEVVVAKDASAPSETPVVGRSTAARAARPETFDRGGAGTEEIPGTHVRASDAAAEAVEPAAAEMSDPRALHRPAAHDPEPGRGASAAASSLPPGGHARPSSPALPPGASGEASAPGAAPAPAAAPSPAPAVDLSPAVAVAPATHRAAEAVDGAPAASLAGAAALAGSRAGRAASAPASPQLRAPSVRAATAPGGASHEPAPSPPIGPGRSSARADGDADADASVSVLPAAESVPDVAAPVVLEPTEAAAPPAPGPARAEPSVSAPSMERLPVDTGRELQAERRARLHDEARSVQDTRALSRGTRAEVDLGEGGRVAVEAKAQPEGAVVVRVDTDQGETARAMAQSAGELLSDLRSQATDARVSIHGPGTSASFGGDGASARDRHRGDGEGAHTPAPTERQPPVTHRRVRIVL